MAPVTLNGTQVYPSNIEQTTDRIGTAIEAANGARRFAHRAYKRTWTITWEAIPEADRATVRTIAALTSTFTFQDETGTSFTAFVDAGAFRSSVSRIATEAGAQVLYYDVALQIREA